MRGSRFISFLLVFTMSTAAWTGCGGPPAPPADSGEIVEDASKLPGANEPYPMKRLDTEETPQAGGPEGGKTEKVKAEESEPPRGGAKPVEDKTD